MRRKHVSQKYYTNTSLMLLRHTGVVDVKLAKETNCTKWGLRSSSPLRVVAIEPTDIFIRGCYLWYPDFLSQGICSRLGLKSVKSLQTWAHQAASV